MHRRTLTLLVTLLLAGPATVGHAALTIPAEKAAVHTEGGPMPGGGWNLWSNGQVGQAVRIAAPGGYQVTVRAWGSPAGGGWPEMALLVDGQTIRQVTVGRADAADYRFALPLTPGIHEIAAAFLNDTMIGKEDRNLYLQSITIRPPPGGADPVLAGKAEAAAAGEERERAAVAATEAAIDRHRKTDATVRVVDSAGRPLTGAKISVEQTGHEFLFGCNIYMFDRFGSPAENAAYKRRFEALFNYATVGFYWIAYEHQRGKPDYPYTDTVVDWCRGRGIRMKGHPLLWGDAAGIPPWSHGQPPPEIQHRRVHDIMTRYGDRIDFWEVVNEPSHQPEPKIDAPYRWAREISPRAYLIVNDFEVLGTGCPDFFRLLTAANEQGVPFDGIGIQAHEPRMMRFPLDRVRQTLDHYASLGKELHITEFTPTSGRQKMVGSPREGVWDESAQADYAEKFYRVCFAHPAVRAITWWDLCDRGAWLPGGGMLRADLSPKPVYEALMRLVHQEWTTRAGGTTDPAGRFAFRGFFGRYRLAIDVPGGTVRREIELTKGPPREIVVRF